MPPIPPNALVVGEQYVSIRRNNPSYPNLFAHPSRFQGINPDGLPRFNMGHGLSIVSNPAIFNFYTPNDPYLQNNYGAQKVNSVRRPGAGKNLGSPGEAGAGAGAGAPGAGADAKGAAQGGRRKTRKSKARKSLKKRSTRKH